jgi:dienelactone hydrolase
MARLLLTIGAVLLGLFVAVMAAFYIVDGHPIPESASFLSGDGYTTKREADGGWLFRPDQPNGRGIVIWHGALIKPQSYAKTAAFFAQRGYTVLLPYGGTTRLPIMALAATAARMQALALDTWFSIGHSMGGMASMEFVQSHPEVPITAAAMWACSIPSDYSTVSTPILFLWGDHDDLLPESRFEGGKEKLPADVIYRTVAGANHKDFAMYGHQFLDGEGQLGWQAQIELANEQTLAFFAGF